MRLLGWIREWILFGFWFQKKVEGVMHGHFSHEIDFDTKLGGLFRKDHPGQIVCLRILLPVDEVITRNDPHRVAENARTCVRAGSQANDLGP